MDRGAEDAGMFVCDCPSCGRRELRGPRSLHPFPVDDGIDWIAHCRACGQAITVAESRPRRHGGPEPHVPATAPRAPQAA